MSANRLATCTPAEVIAGRSAAFARGDFGFIYDSYHADSNFRRQFAIREEYLTYGRDSLGQDYRIVSCQILAEHVTASESRVVYLMEMQVRGRRQRYAELAWLRRENAAWRYHRGQKMAEEEFPGNPEELGFSDFAGLDPATIF
jgi:SEC-C motif-containing protein